MTSKTSYNMKDKELKKTNPEKAWMTESLSCFKLIPILLTIVYFFINILPILIFYSRFELISAYVNESMRVTNVLNMLVAIGAGVVAACAVFGYLHKSYSATDAHSRPLTRNALFRASFSSGLIMVAVPIVITGILYVFVQGAHVSQDIDKETIYAIVGENYKVSDMLSLPNAFGWMIDNLLMVMFAYCISVFAGILAGTGLIQTLLSFFLMALPTTVYFIAEGYFSIYLRGYTMELKGIQYLSPYSYMFTRAEFPLSKFSIIPFIYVAVMLVLVVSAHEIYKRIHLENEENSIVVPYVSPVLVIILTFISVSILLFISDTVLTINNSVGISLLVMLLGTAIFFPIFCMIANQSFRVFNKRNLRTLGIFAVIMCITCAFTMFDVSGYEERIPDIGNIAKVDIVGNEGFENEKEGNNEIDNIENPDTIKMVVSLHEAIINTKSTTRQKYKTHFAVTYHQKDGKVIKREYNDVTGEAIKIYEYLYNDRYIRSRERFNLSDIEKKGMSVAVYRHGDVNEDPYASYLVPKNLVPGLIQAANKDIMNWTADNRNVFYALEGTKPIYDVKIIKNQSEPMIYLDKSFTGNDRYVGEFIQNHPEIFAKENKKIDY